MNKATLIKQVADRAQISKKDATAAVNAVFEIISENLNDGVAISGFGTFGVKVRDARQGFNPVTKEKVEIPASRAPFFKPAKALKDICKGSGEETAE